MTKKLALLALKFQLNSIVAVLPPLILIGLVLLVFGHSIADALGLYMICQLMASIVAHAIWCSETIFLLRKKKENENG